MNKGEPYTLRKYKMIFKREMEDYPHLYDVLDSEGNPKEKIDGIVGDDERLYHNTIGGDENMPKDYEDELRAYKKREGIIDYLTPEQYEEEMRKDGMTEE